MGWTSGGVPRVLSERKSWVTQTQVSNRTRVNLEGLIDKREILNITLSRIDTSGRLNSMYVGLVLFLTTKSTFPSGPTTPTSLSSSWVQGGRKRKYTQYIETEVPCFTDESEVDRVGVR